MKITSLLFGLVFSALFFSSIAIFMADLSNNYNVAYDNSTFDLYTRLNDTQAQAFEISASINESATEQGIVDILGGLVTKGVDSLKLTYKSLTTSTVMVTKGISDIGLPDQFSSAIVTAMFIFVIIGVIISVLVKVPL